MATISLVRIGDRVSINLDCLDDNEASELSYTLASAILDGGPISLEISKPVRAVIDGEA